MSVCVCVCLCVCVCVCLVCLKRKKHKFTPTRMCLCVPPCTRNQEAQSLSEHVIEAPRDRALQLISLGAAQALTITLERSLQVPEGAVR